MTSWSEARHPRDDHGRFEDAEAARSAWSRRVEASSPPSAVPHVSSLPPGDPPAGAEEWWDEDAQERPPGDEQAFRDLRRRMRDWRALPVPAPPPEEPMDRGMAKAMRCDTPEGRAEYDRLRAYRSAGYDGPLDEHCRIPDPDDPENWEWLRAGAALRKHGA
jgi:hypothetical protein